MPLITSSGKDHSYFQLYTAGRYITNRDSKRIFPTDSTRACCCYRGSYNQRHRNFGADRPINPLYWPQQIGFLIFQLPCTEIVLGILIRNPTKVLAETANLPSQNWLSGGSCLLVGNASAVVCLAKPLLARKEVIHGRIAYVTEPGNISFIKGIIIIVPDAIGWRFVNNRILADHHASKVDYRVIFQTSWMVCHCEAYTPSGHKLLTLHRLFGNYLDDRRACTLIPDGWQQILALAAVR